MTSKSSTIAVLKRILNQ